MKKGSRSKKSLTPQAKPRHKKITNAFLMAPVAMAITSPEGMIIDANQRFLDLTGYSLAELKKSNLAKLTASVNSQINLRAFEAMLLGANEVYRTKKRFRHKDGSVLLTNLTASLIKKANGKPDFFVAALEPASEEKNQNSQIRRLNRLYSILVRTNNAIFLETDRSQIMQRVCDLLVQEGDLCLAYIVRHNPENDDYVPLVSSGARLVDLQQITLGKKTGPLSKGPIVSAIKTGRPSVCNDILNDKRMKPWRHIAVVQGCHSTVAIPIPFGKKYQLVLSVGAKARNYFSYDEIDLLMMVAKNLAYTFQSFEREAARSHSEQQYRESEARFRHMAENIADVFWLANANLDTVFYVSPAFEKIWARPASSLLENQKVWLDSVHPDDRMMVMGNFYSPKRNTSFEIEYRIVRPDGSERWIQDRTFPIRDQNGDLVTIAGIARDITDRHLAEAELYTMHRRLSSLLENLTDGYAELDRDLRFIYCNSAFGKMFHTSDKQIRGKYVWEIFPGVMETSHGQALRKALDSGKIQVIEDYYAPLFGWYEQRIYPTEDRLSVFVRDNTETQELSNSLMRERARLVHAQSVAKIGSWETDLQTLQVEWSEETYNIFEIDPITYKPSHTTFLEFVHPEDKDLVNRTFTASFSQTGICTISHRILTANGLEKYVEECWQVFRNADGEPVRAVGTCQDITERHRAETENRRLVDRLTATFESITDAFMFIDTNWCFSYLNQQAERLMRKKRSDLLGKNLWQSFPGAEEGDFGYQYKYAMRTGEPVSFEGYYDPLAMWVNVRVFPSDQGIAVYFRDINEELISRRQLAASEARFRELAENIQEIFYVLEPENGHVTYISPAYEKTWGRKCEDLLADPLSYLDAIHPDDRSTVETSLKYLRDGEKADIEYRILRPDGSVRWIRDFSYPIFDANGKVDHIIGVSHDITERRLTDIKMREQASLLDKARDAILVRNLDDTIRYWNNSARALYGWQAEEVIGKSVRDLLYSDPGAYAKAMSELMQTGEWSGDLEQVARDGRKIIIEGRWTLVRDDKGEPHSVLAINADVTEKRIFEQHILRTQRLESIGTLAGGIAHDLNNMLTPIMLASEILRSNAQDDDSKSLLDTIETSSRRGADMVSQILAFAKGNDGDKTTIDVVPILKDIEKIVKDTFPKNINIILNVAENLRSIVADATQLHQVILNLCVNARDAMPKGGGIVISALNAEIDDNFAAMVPGATPGSYVLIEVRDTGTGIPESVIEKIFDPFFTTKDVGQGTGLGLSTSLKIVQNHNGFMQVESKVGEGSIFRVFLACSAKTQTHNKSAPSTTILRGNGEMVLVVDDEEPIRMVTKQILEEYGYRVCTATDGAEGIIRFTENRNEVKAIISDMMMPTMDGPSFAHVIRKLSPELPVIVVSGVANEAALRRLTDIGIHNFLQKPFSGETLLRLLHECISGET